VIGDRVVIDNDGSHGAEERRGMIALRAGLHPLRVDYFQATGGAALSLRYRVGGGDWTPVPAGWLVSLP
jgi:hexosaminidase